MRNTKDCFTASVGKMKINLKMFGFEIIVLSEMINDQIIIIKEREMSQKNVEHTGE